MMTSYPARFITLEGTEGVGKSTNLAFIEQWLQSEQIPYIVTREPGGTELGEAIRELLLSTRYKGMSEMAELLLMFAARAQHVDTKIRPALEAGTWVLSDRFTDASFAYQAGGRGLDWEVLSQLEKWVQKDLQPDLTILLDCPVEIGMARARSRGELDRFEQEKISFFERVRQTYLKRAAANASRFAVIDASCELDAVQQQISTALNSLRGRR